MLAGNGKKRIALVGVLVIATVIAIAVSTWKSDIWPVLAAPANPYKCGEVTVAGQSWLGGNGVDVHSNGDKQTTGTGCANGDKQIYDLAANPPVYGYAWQCVELVNRLYAVKGWFPQLWLGDDTNHGAKWIYTYAERGKYAGLTAHANGSGYKPVPGDMIVHSSGTYGHVSIVDRVAGDTLYAVEQNNSATGWAMYTFESTKGTVSRKGATISGFVHAAKNGMPDTAKALSLKIVGSCTTAGGTLTSESLGFTSGGAIDISGWYEDGRAYTNLRRDAVARADGTVPWTWPCKGDPPGRYGTRIVDLATGRHVDASFVVGSAPVQSPTVASPPNPPPTQPPPLPTTQPPPPTTRTVTSYNKVTNGPSAMREDTSPTYLSSQMRAFCKSNGCAMPNTDMWSGVQMTAVCQAQGARMTNGQDNSSIDDNNPGLFTSTRWYGIRWPDGRFGYISEIWVEPGNRGGLGLPGC